MLRGGTRQGGVITLVRHSSDQLFFVYAGAAQRVGIDPRAFFTRTRLFERNVVLLRDGRNAFYQQGISHAIDSFDALLGWHHELRASMPHVRRVFTVGSSMGAYAAILFGCLLEAEQVWALGPPVTRLDQAEGFPQERTDLAVLLERSTGRTSYHVHYSEGCPADVEAARRIAHCEGVRLHAHPGTDHNVVTTMAGGGALETLFPAPG